MGNSISVHELRIRCISLEPGMEHPNLVAIVQSRKHITSSLMEVNI